MDISLRTNNDVKNTSVLKFPSVSYTDAGIYECIAENDIPPSIRSNFTINIHGMKILFQSNQMSHDYIIINVS